MLRTLLAIGAGGAILAVFAKNGRVAGYDLTQVADAPLPLLLFVGFTALLLLSLRWI